MPCLSLSSGLPRGAQANQKASLKDQSESSPDRSFFSVFGGISGLRKTKFLKMHRSLALGRNEKTETETEVGGRIHRSSPGVRCVRGQLAGRIWVGAGSFARCWFLLEGLRPDAWSHFAAVSRFGSAQKGVVDEMG